MNIVDAMKQAYDHLKAKVEIEEQYERVLYIRSEVLQAYYDLWEVDNVDDLLKKMADYELRESADERD